MRSRPAPHRRGEPRGGGPIDMRRRRVALGTIPALAAVIAAVLSTAPPAGAAWQNFRGSSDGLADGQVLAIHENGDGSLWFGTPRGPSHFDGLRWSTPDLGTSNPVVQAIAPARDGSVWFGLQGGGAVRYVPGVGVTRRLGAASGLLPSDNVQAILEDHRGDFWFGTPNGLARWEPDGDRWTLLVASAGGLVHPNVWRLLEDRHRNLWVATPEGVGRLDASRLAWRSFTADPNGLGRDSVLAMAEDRDGGLWFGTDQGAWRLEDDGGVPRWEHFATGNGPRNPVILDIAPDSAGGVWLAGSGGLDHFDRRTWRSFESTTEGLPLGRVFSLHPDRSGNLWIGTEANGLFRYDRVDLQGYIAPVGASACSPRPSLGGRVQSILQSNCTQDLLEDRNGEVWVATADRGAARLDRTGRWTFLRRAAGRPLSDSLSCLYEDREGRLWFGSGNVAGGGRYTGVAVWNADRTGWSSWRGPSVLPDDNVLSLHQDRSGGIWVGTAAGVALERQGTWRSFLASGGNGVPASVYAIHEDSTGGIWLRTSQGLYRMGPDDDAPRRLEAADGLWTSDVRAVYPAPSGEVWIAAAGGFGAWRNGRVEPSDLASGDAEAIRVDSRGDLWVGLSHGALRVGPAGSTLFGGDVLGSTPVIGIHEDRSGAVWVATFGGLARTNGVEWTTFTTSDGLVSSQVYHVLEDRRGRLWFGGFSGITQVDPDATAPQTVFVTTPPPLLPTRNARFVYTAAYGEGGDVEYRARLDGIGGGWSGVVTAEFSGLSDGLHVFDVEARDWSRNVDPTPASFTFEVDATPPPAVIVEPVFGQPVRGDVTVLGRADDARFRSWRLEAKRVEFSGWEGAHVLTLAASDAPVPDGPLATWATRGLPDGNYDLRLVVEDTLGLTGIDPSLVIVDNHEPFADVTSPVRIAASQGGHVYTTNAEVHLYFPPRAFDLDALVSIRPAAPPASGGSAGETPGWDIAWGGSTLQKSAVIELDRPASTGEPGVLHRSSDGGATWVSIGGSPTAGGTRIAGVIDAPGLYAVRPGVDPPGDGRGLSPPVLIPRLFTPGAGSTGDVAISFTLGRPGPVTVRIFNRAGRLVREVAAGETMPGGLNLLRWNGRGEDGDVVTDGLYFVRVEAADEARVEALVVRR